MSGSGPTHYSEELKNLLRLLKNLPETIPEGNTHNFIGYVPDPEKVVDTGCVKSVISHRLEISFGPRCTPAGEPILLQFKPRGPALEEVCTVLRNHITGNGGSNVLLALWVDDFTRAAATAITASGNPLPRVTQTTVAKRLLEDAAATEQAKKKQKKDGKDAKAAKKAATEIAKKRTEQGPMKWPFEDLKDDPVPPPPAGMARGAPTQNYVG
ncbi:hypothetical protein B0H10DRAFT_2232500 [Mycena sp. CBHHK59/15]|nr:hypothetical protein B0H10DRAFT_2232500 [Mycena sp. CBHHK59/15]